MPDINATLLSIAHLARPHGVHGELSALPIAPPVLDPHELIEGRRLYLLDPRGKLSETRGESLREHQNRWLIKLEGIDDMTAANALRGHDLCLPRSELPPLPDGWYYENDLAGCHVIDERLGEIGTVQSLDLGYAQPQLRLARPGGQTVLIPWRKAYFPAVDLVGRIISARLPQGLPGIEDDAAL